MVRGTLVALVGLPSLASGQQLAQKGSCTLTPGEYERAGYVLGHVSVRNVFNFVRVLSPLADESHVQFPKALAPFRVKEATDAAKALFDFVHGRPEENDSPFAVTIVVDFIENCTDAGGERRLDLVYTVVTNRIPLTSGLTFESRKAQTDDAPRAVGAVSEAQRVRLMPRFSYTASDHLQAGGRATIHTSGGLFDTASVDAWGSNSSRLLRGSFAGARISDGAIARTDWSLSGSDSERPADSQRLIQRRVMGQMSAQSRPLRRVGAVLRFGASFEDGEEQASLGPGILDATSLADTTYGAMRAYSGVSLNTQHHAFSGSYGLLLGGVPQGRAIDYRKSIVDAAYALRANVADHRTLEVETRVTAGWLQTPGSAPAAERFYGGNVEQDFIEGDTWRIRATPTIRSIPNGSLNRLSLDPGTGGRNFFALNLTASVPVWRLPLVPTAISTLKEFKDAVEQTKGNAREQTSAYYRSKDPAQQKAQEEAATVSASLHTLFDHVKQIQPGAPAAVRQRVADCLDAVDLAQDRMQHLSNTGYGPVSTLIIPDVLSACRDDLNIDLNDPVVAAESNRLTMVGASIAATMKQVDESGIAAKVDADLGFAFRAFDTFLHEVNGVSVGPAIIFDVARIGPQPTSLGGGVRYGIGGGVRIGVMNVMNITVGYARNPEPLPWEGPGAFFMSLDFVDLFR